MREGGVEGIFRALKMHYHKVALAFCDIEHFELNDEAVLL